MAVQVEKGYVVSFIYDKGSHPGSRRLVKVEKVDNQHLEGYDLRLKIDGGTAYRNFRFDDMRDFQQITDNTRQIVLPEQFIQDKVLLEKITGETKGETSALAEQIYKLKNPQTKWCFWDSKNKVMITKPEDYVNIELNIKNGELSLDFVSPTSSNERVSLYWAYKDGPLKGGMKLPIPLNSMKDFVNQLTNLFDQADTPPQLPPYSTDYISTKPFSWAVYNADQMRKEQNNGTYSPGTK